MWQIYSRESGIATITTKRCTAHEFECIHDSTCIDLSSVGDGIPDCMDASDECPDPNSQFRCRCGQPVCIDRQHYMDGQINCEDGSDEGLEVTVCQSFIHNELLPNETIGYSFIQFFLSLIQ
ncbi:hypothetical protein BLA29_000089 [Euroglyphus maynei]|uniref:Uncharacterized protein n=1 Tax=Euroglyphus maynei TaxID=6958 RepID=A0A1Y3BEV0_EURMA|nr:hypothetical protein BLA29_000089 [Euroglyphus maynei]